MEILHAALCVLFMVTLATSKPISLTESEDSSKSSESSESKSSEETVANEEPLQPALTETETANTVGETDPPADPGPSLSTVDTAALPNAEDPQTSADVLQVIPDDPSQTALGTDVSQDMPDTDPAINTDNVLVLPDTDVSLYSGHTESDLFIGTGGANPQVTTASTYQIFPQDATPPFLPHIIKPTSPFSTASPMPIPISTALTGVPVCFTFQFATSEPDPPRGDI